MFNVVVEWRMEDAKGDASSAYWSDVSSAPKISRESFFREHKSLQLQRQGEARRMTLIELQKGVLCHCPVDEANTRLPQTFSAACRTLICELDKDDSDFGSGHQ